MIGLLLIAAALFLTIYNFMDDNRASRSAHGVMDQLREMRPEKELRKMTLHPRAQPERLRCRIMC